MKKDKHNMKNSKNQQFFHSPIPAYRFLLIFLVFLLSHSSFLTGLDFSIRPKAFAFIPSGPGNAAEDGNVRYSVGGGGELGFEIDLSTVWPNPLGLGYTAGLEGSMLFNSLQGDTPETVSFYSFGGTLGLYFFPLSRLFTRIDGAVGVNKSAREEGSSEPGLFWRGGGEIGFRFTPGFTLAANAGWRQFLHSGDALDSGSILNSGIYAGLTAQVSFQTGRGGIREGVHAGLDQYGPVYPVFMQLYQSYPIGTVVIRNNGNAEIRNVRLFFRASGYTVSQFPCGEVSAIPRGRSVELPLLADFSPDILHFTDSGRIVGELVIRYTFLGREQETIQALTIATHNRNTVPIGDGAAFAAFVSPVSPEILDFARFIAGLYRAGQRSSLNQNMQYAVWLLEGLKASNIFLDGTYTDEGEAQYPAETLSYRNGSSRDLAILFACALEAVGISSAFIQTENDFFAAVSLGIGANAAETLFSNMENILVIDGNVWLPLSMDSFNEGFSSAWEKGAAVLAETFAEEKQADFIIVEDAWASYPPAPLPELGRNSVQTDIAAATQEVNRALLRYIEQEIQPLLLEIQRQISTSPNASLYNRMGLLQTRAGRISEAKATYERAAGMGSIPAMTNRGNLALSEQDYSTAERWFRQALERDSQNSAALRGMVQVQENR